MEAAERGCSGRPDPKETGRPNPTGNYCVFFPTGCFSPPNFSRRLSISPKMHFLLLKRIFLSAPQAKKIFDPPSPGCFAPPDVFPPPKNFGRVGGEKHSVVTGRPLLRTSSSDMLRQRSRSRGGQVHFPTAVMKESLRFEREALRLNGSLPG